MTAATLSGVKAIVRDAVASIGFLPSPWKRPALRAAPDTLNSVLTAVMMLFHKTDMKSWIRVAQWLTLIVFLCFAVAVMLLWNEQKEGRPHPVIAHITGFSAIGNSRFNPVMTTVIARTADGYTGTDRVPFEVLAERGCKVGDPIAGVMNGRFLVVNARRCGRARTR